MNSLYVQDEAPTASPRRVATLFLCGDVMTGRGIDQVLPHPSRPHLFEPYVRSAKEYVDLAERANGPIPRPVDLEYVWGDALAELDAMRPDARIINLETSITTAEDAWRGKGIHYRMHPANIGVLTAAKIDCCALANNHVLDWGYDGLAETLATLHAAGIRTAGAGADEVEAAAPAILGLSHGGRVLVFAWGMENSGVESQWAAAKAGAGVNFLLDFSARSFDAVARQVRALKRAGDIAVASIHWGGNWGYHIDDDVRGFAHRLIDRAGIDVVHGHSSHHPQAVEIHRQRPILYGCGDFLNDYEGIGGYESYRPELALMYFPMLDTDTGELLRFSATPMRVRRFRVNRATEDEAIWLERRLARESERFGTHVERESDGRLLLRAER